MRRLLLTLALWVALAAVAGAAFAQNAPVAPPKPAVPRTTAPANPMAVPPPPRMEMTRSAPCILPTLRLVNPQMMQTLSMRLSLTDDQKSKVADLLDKADKEIKPKIEAQIKAGQDYVAQLTKPTVTQAELTAVADKAMKAETDVLMARINTLFALKALLTPDQNKLLADRLAQYSYPWREGGRPMPNPTPNPVSAPAK
jgi:Spy/CpxP family protein refolding chaperone